MIKIKNFIVLISLLSFMHIDAMEQEKKIWKVHSSQETPDESFAVDEDILMLSQTIRNMIEDITSGGMTDISIPLQASRGTINYVFNILKLYTQGSFADIEESMKILSPEQFINVFTFLDWLEVPDRLKKIFESGIKNRMAINAGTIVKNTSFQQMDPDAQKFLMFDLVLNYLKNEIIKKYAEKRKIVLDGDLKEPYVGTVAFSPDSNKIISGLLELENNLILWNISNLGKITHQFCNGNAGGLLCVIFNHNGTKIASCSTYEHDNLILWDISNPHQPKHQSLNGHSNGGASSAQFSPDDNKIISGSYGDQNNLILWDISNPNAITHQVLDGHPNNVNSVMFSRNGRRIVSCSDGDHNNLILWDISNPHSIMHQILDGSQKNVNIVAFSPDGNRIVSGSVGNQNNLILWDISDPNAITHQILDGHQKDVITAAFSPDGRMIVSGSWGNPNNLILWNISNPNSITHQILTGHSSSVNKAAFSPDGSMIISCSNGSTNNLILWDINNPDQPTHQMLTGHSGVVEAVAFSPNGSKIVSGSNGNLILWNLWTNKESQLFNDLKTYPIDQIGLLYRLCLAQQQNLTIYLTNVELELFRNLPKLIRDLLLRTISQESQQRFLRLVSSESLPVELLPPSLMTSLQEMVRYHQTNSDPERKDVAESAIKKLKEIDPQYREQINKVLEELHFMGEKEQLLKKQKEDIRRYLNHPAIQADLPGAIEKLKKIYTPDNELYEAFNEVIHEMGY